MHNGFLPREGFCLDVILKLLRRTAFNPSLVLPLVLLSRYTKKGQDWSILHPTAARRLKQLLYFALVRRLSNWLSDKASNNWVNDKYVWSREIVVITGGAAGIGATMVRCFAELGITVVVLDVQAMTFSTSTFLHNQLLVMAVPWLNGATHGPSMQVHEMSLTSSLNRLKGPLLSVRP